jgi:hypothetical protein
LINDLTINEGLDALFLPLPAAFVRVNVRSAEHPTPRNV